MYQQCTCHLGQQEAAAAHEQVMQLFRFAKNAVVTACKAVVIVCRNLTKCVAGVQVYWWHDKYRPRKPKYFNRVHTGYEWNKYNQTHYDHDNPPPKVCYQLHS